MPFFVASSTSNKKNDGKKSKARSVSTASSNSGSSKARHAPDINGASPSPSGTQPKLKQNAPQKSKSKPNLKSTQTSKASKKTNAKDKESKNTPSSPSHAHVRVDSGTAEAQEQTEMPSVALPPRNANLQRLGSDPEVYTLPPALVPGSGSGSGHSHGNGNGNGWFESGPQQMRVLPVYLVTSPNESGPRGWTTSPGEEGSSGRSQSASPPPPYAAIDHLHGMIPLDQFQQQLPLHLYPLSQVQPRRPLSPPVPSPNAIQRPSLPRQPYSAPGTPLTRQFALSQQNLATFDEANPIRRTNVRNNAEGPSNMEDRMSVFITQLDEEEDEAEEDLDDSPNPLNGALMSPQAGSSNNTNRLVKLATQSRGILSLNHCSKVWAYSNSRLPVDLAPFLVYLPTFPLLNLAATYSLSSYSKKRTPRPDSTVSISTTATVRIPASLSMGTKAMKLALTPHRYSNKLTLVLAIRGTATFADWAVNFRPSPAAPQGVLDDAGNLVHSGFLAVARNMIVPVAEQLMHFLALQTDREAWRERGQLLITGHSAGGGVASLLFCHILSQSEQVSSPLKDMRTAFKRVHCITFGVPPISLLPLERPKLVGAPTSPASTSAPPAYSTVEPAEAMQKRQRSWKKNLFFTFINEGDPVARADRAFVKSLLELYGSPVAPAGPGDTGGPIWKVPQNTLSVAGNIVVLRQKGKPSVAKRRGGLLRFGKTAEPVNDDDDQKGIEAIIATDEQLRSVVYGDPTAHSMRLYQKRIRKLAVKAVMRG